MAEGWGRWPPGAQVLRWAGLTAASDPGYCSPVPGVIKSMESSRNKRVVSAALIVYAVLGFLYARPALAEATDSALEQGEKFTASEKSEWGAFGLALGVTVVPGGIAAATWGTEATWLSVVLAVGAITVGPASGHIYVGEDTHAVLTSLGRLVLFATGVGMFGYAFIGEHSSQYTTPILGTAIGCFVATATLAVYDIVDAPFAAQRHNEKLRKEINLTLTPLMIPQGYQQVGQPLYGLSLSGAF